MGAELEEGSGDNIKGLNLGTHHKLGRYCAIELYPQLPFICLFAFKGKVLCSSGCITEVTLSF